MTRYKRFADPVDANEKAVEYVQSKLLVMSDEILPREDTDAADFLFKMERRIAERVTAGDPYGDILNDLDDYIDDAMRDAFSSPDLDELIGFVEVVLDAARYLELRP